MHTEAPPKIELELITTKIFTLAVQHAKQILADRNADKSLDDVSYLRLRQSKLDTNTHRLTDLHYHYALLALAIAQVIAFIPSYQAQILREAQTLINTYPNNDTKIEEHLPLLPPSLEKPPSPSDLATHLARVVLIREYPDNYIPYYISERMKSWCTVNLE